MKKIISFLVAILVILSVSSAFAAGFTDVAESDPLYEKIQLLSELEILNGYEDGSFRPNNTVKRSEFTAMVIRALELSDVADGMKNKRSFNDVPQGHWAEGFINLAADMGIINGRGEGIFDPEGKVLHEEAIKMLMVAMGYIDLAENYGGYPNGYIQIARTIGSLDGIQVEKGTAADRKMIAEMFYNSLADEYMSGEETEEEITDTVSAFEKEVLTLVNEIRVDAGLSSLSWDDALGQVARAHSEDMRNRNYMAHDNPDGLSPFDRMRNAGIHYMTAAENVAAGQTTPQAVVDSWMNSEGHRANILNPDFNKLGVGYASGGGIYGHYWTQNFTN